MGHFFLNALIKNEQCKVTPYLNPFGRPTNHKTMIHENFVFEEHLCCETAIVPPIQKPEIKKN